MANNDVTGNGQPFPAPDSGQPVQDVPDQPTQPVPSQRTGDVITTPLSPEALAQVNPSVLHKQSTPPGADPRAAAAQNIYQAKPVITVRNLRKVYRLGRGVEVPALQGVSLAIYPGEFVAVMGPSGSGKSTFMNLMGCLDRPSGGDYWLNGRLVSQLSGDELAAVRNRQIGFVFQGFNLLGRANAIKNVALPMVYMGVPTRERERRALKALQLVGLGRKGRHKPLELSGGEQQRVAIARALVNGPALLLADEPTGNLDSRTGLEIMTVFQALNQQGLTIVLVTHDQNIANYAKRRVIFLDGRVIEDTSVAEPRSAEADWLAALREAELEHGMHV